MPIIQPDLTEAADLTPIPEGTYPGVIKKADPKKSKEKGTNMLELAVGVTHDGKEKNRRFYAMVEGPGSNSFDNLLRACHMDELADVYKDPTATKPPFDTDTLLNQQVQVIIVPEIFQRKDGNGNPVGDPEVRDRIKGFLPA